MNDVFAVSPELHLVLQIFNFLGSMLQNMCFMPFTLYFFSFIVLLIGLEVYTHLQRSQAVVLVVSSQLHGLH